MKGPSQRSLPTIASTWFLFSHCAIVGRLRWDGPFNYIYGTDLYKVKQNQNGKWVVIWPKEFAASGVRLITP